MHNDYLEAPAAALGEFKQNQLHMNATKDFHPHARVPVPGQRAQANAQGSYWC